MSQKPIRVLNTFSHISCSVSSLSRSAGFHVIRSFIALWHFAPNFTSPAHYLCYRGRSHSFSELSHEIYERMYWNSSPISVAHGHFTAHTSTTTSLGSRFPSAGAAQSAFRPWTISFPPSPPHTTTPRVNDHILHGVVHSIVFCCSHDCSSFVTRSILRYWQF